MMGQWGSGMGFGWVLMVLFWGLVIAGIVATIKWFSDQSRARQDGA